MQITNITPTEQKENDKIRIAAYCRVSIDSQDQIHSFAAQIRHYSDYVNRNPRYTLIDIYADEGLSGTEMTKRDELNRLLKDCSHGKVDRIVTKSVSRLARNTEDLLSMLRMIKGFGVSVYFEEQGIDTTQMNMEMIVTFPGMAAQQESETISGNLRWAIRKKMEKGEYVISRPAYGFYLKGKSSEKNEAEAEIVRKIFKWYLRGMGMQQIADRLNAENIPYSYNASKQWQKTTIQYILSNEKYIGDGLFQKSYTTQGLPFKRLDNKGERAKYYVENYNPAVIDKETFKKAQNLRETRSKNKFAESGKHILSGKIRCPDCGYAFRLYTCRGKAYWGCSLNSGTGKCKSRRVRENAVFETFIYMAYKLKLHRNEIIVPLIKAIERLQEKASENGEIIKRIDKEIADLSAKNLVVTKLYTSGVLNVTDYNKQVSEIVNRIKSLRTERKKRTDEDEDVQLTELRTLDEKINECALIGGRLNTALFDQIVEKIVVIDCANIKFYLIGGLVLTETIKEIWRCKQK